MCKWLEVRPICPTCLRIRAHRDVGDQGDPLIKDPWQITLCDTALRLQKICSADQEERDAPSHTNILSSILCKSCKDINADQLLGQETFRGNAEFQQLHDKLTTNQTYFSTRPYQRAGNQGALLRLLMANLMTKEERLRDEPLKIPRNRTATLALVHPENESTRESLRRIWDQSMVETDVDKLNAYVASPYTLEFFRTEILATEQALEDDVCRFAYRIRTRVWGDPNLDYDARLITIACLLIASGALDNHRTFEDFARLTRTVRDQLQEVVNVIWRIAPEDILQSLYPAPSPGAVQPVNPRSNPHDLSDSGSSGSSGPSLGPGGRGVSPLAHQDPVEDQQSVGSPQYQVDSDPKTPSPYFQPEGPPNDREGLNGFKPAEDAVVSRFSRASPGRPIAAIEVPRYDGRNETSPAETRKQHRLQAQANTGGHAGPRSLSGGAADTIVVHRSPSVERSDSDKENRDHHEVEHTDEEDSEENQDEGEEDKQNDNDLDDADESNGDAANGDSSISEDLDGGGNDGELDDDASTANVAGLDGDEEEEEDELGEAVAQTPTPIARVSRRPGLRNNTQPPEQRKGAKRELESDGDDSEDDYKPVKQAKTTARTRSGTVPASRGATAQRSRGRVTGRRNRG